MAKKQKNVLGDDKKWYDQERNRGQKNPKYVTSQHAQDVQEAEGHLDRHFKHHSKTDRLLGANHNKNHKPTE